MSRDYIVTIKVTVPNDLSAPTDWDWDELLNEGAADSDVIGHDLLSCVVIPAPENPVETLQRRIEALEALVARLAPAEAAPATLGTHEFMGEVYDIVEHAGCDGCAAVFGGDLCKSVLCSQITSPSGKSIILVRRDE